MINNPFPRGDPYPLHDGRVTVRRQLGAIARLSPDARPIIAAILTDGKQK